MSFKQFLIENAQTVDKDPGLETSFKYIGFNMLSTTKVGYWVRPGAMTIGKYVNGNDVYYRVLSADGGVIKQFDKWDSLKPIRFAMSKSNVAKHGIYAPKISGAPAAAPAPKVVNQAPKPVNKVPTPAPVKVAPVPPKPKIEDTTDIKTLLMTAYEAFSYKSRIYQKDLEPYKNGQWSEISIRDWGQWEVPEGEDDDGDYDWQVLTNKWHDVAEQICNDLNKRFKKATFQYSTGEKNWLYIRVKV